MFRDYTQLYPAECEHCGRYVSDDCTLSDSNWCVECEADDAEAEAARDRQFDIDNASSIAPPYFVTATVQALDSSVWEWI